ncbi:putative homeodomain-interacting protein kinase 2-like [Scophthalmus maximus]|uniref:Putative homeodomain-interacting protein kinase 2-like n=1 Tax=Scophthalmus maximus TaxID=52904 RepID=A0A2U9CJM9_SCOMX|nr:putative homeodomain-interacting protein kinase 2-like [Scophthalmus maximus]
MGLHNEGYNGKVAKCFNVDKAKMVLIKIQKDTENDLFQQELAMLEAVRVLDSDNKNIRECMPLSLSEIRLLTHQLLVSLEALKSIGIIHTDIKLDNIMLVNHKDQPFKIKLINFGLALPVSQVKVGMYMQNRTPEVTLGLPLSEAVDMWGVGCIMTNLYFGTSVFPWDCAYNWMKTMVHLLGQPEDHLLAAGIYSYKYFIFDQDTGWRLRTPEEYEDATGARPKVPEEYGLNLENAIKNFCKKENWLEHKDRMAFFDLLICCLHLDAERRISPSEALKQSFLTMVHMVDELETSSYADTALELMKTCPDRACKRTLFQRIRKFFRRLTEQGVSVPHTYLPTDAFASLQRLMSLNYTQYLTGEQPVPVDGLFQLSPDITSERGESFDLTLSHSVASRSLMDEWR